MATFFSDHFNIDPSLVDRHGAFNVSLITDLPLFIDPFLLFNSRKKNYKTLHDEMIKYLVFLKDKAIAGEVSEALLRRWYCFPEIKQTWLGFSQVGNEGHGLGINFARALHRNLHKLFPHFGRERITKDSHLEKVCLVGEGVGRDNISDFTTNLIKNFLCDYTQTFTLRHLNANQRRTVSIANVHFNYETESWERSAYTLPWIDNDYVRRERGRDVSVAVNVIGPTVQEDHCTSTDRTELSIPNLQIAGLDLLQLRKPALRSASDRWELPRHGTC